MLFFVDGENFLSTPLMGFEYLNRDFRPYIGLARRKKSLSLSTVGSFRRGGILLPLVKVSNQRAGTGINRLPPWFPTSLHNSPEEES